MRDFFKKIIKLNIFRVVITFLMMSLTSPGFAADEEEFVAAETVEELEARLKTILEETAVPGMTASIVYGDEIIWLGALGVANTESGAPVTDETLFRVGSISKSFTSLAILQLVERGELSLDDLIRDVAPEASIKNRWADSDPITVAHVLEHTAGFDDIHFRDYLNHNPESTTVEGIVFNNGSASARWRPGTRVAYSNIGPPIAALALENVSGTTIEDFIDEEIFTPLGMDTATYFQNDKVAASYDGDGSPMPYIGIGMRASGALNATGEDMAQVLKLFNGRGQVGGVRIIEEASLARMETPTTSLAAKHGLPTGYGLSNYSTQQEGFVFQGHNGGIDGFASTYGYLPDAQRAYFFSINQADMQVFQRINKEIVGFVTHDLTPSIPTPTVELSANELEQYTGFYEIDAPRVQLLAGLQRVTFIQITQDQGKLFVKPLVGPAVEIFPKGNDLFAREDAALPSSIFIESPDGEYFFMQALAANKRISPLVAYGRAFSLIFAVVMSLAFFLYNLFWVPLTLLNKKKKTPHVAVRVIPLLALASLGLCVLGLFAVNDFQTIASVTGLTLSLWLGSILFPLCAFIAAGIVIAKYRYREIIGVKTWYFYLLSAWGMLILALSIVSWGLFGLQTWTY